MSVLSVPVLAPSVVARCVSSKLFDNDEKAMFKIGGFTMATRWCAQCRGPLCSYTGTVTENHALAQKEANEHNKDRHDGKIVCLVVED